MRYLFILLVWPCLVIGQTYAGGLQSFGSPDLQIAEQNITLNVNTVKVLYTYVNSSNQDISQTLVFALPSNSDNNPKPPAITVNQQPVQIQIMQRAISQSGHDVSRELKNLGLPFNPIAAIHSIDASSNRDSLIAKLRNLHVLDKHEDTPTWTVKTYYYWQQNFPAHSNTMIEHAYKPNVLSQSVKLHSLSSILKMPIKVVKKVWNLAVHWTLEDKTAVSNLREQFEKYWPQIKNYCATNNDYLFLFDSYKQKNKKKSQIEIKEMAYAIAPQDIWAHSIAHFNLHIESPKNMYPILCWQADLKRMPNNHLQFTADNFVPLQDLKIVYIEN